MGNIVVAGTAVVVGVAVGELVAVGVAVVVVDAVALLVGVAVVVVDGAASVVDVDGKAVEMSVDGEAVGMSVVVAVVNRAAVVDVDVLIAGRVPVAAVAAGVMVSVVGEASVAVNVGVLAVAVVAAPAGVLVAVAVPVDKDVATAVGVAIGVVVAVGMVVAVLVGVLADVVVAVAIGMLGVGVGATGSVVAVGAAVKMAGDVGVVVLVGLGVDVADVVTDGGSGVFVGVFVFRVGVVTGAVVRGKGVDDGGTVAVRAWIGAAAVRVGVLCSALAVAVAPTRGRGGRFGVAVPLAPVIVCRVFARGATCWPDSAGQRGPPRPKVRCAPPPRPTFSTRRVPIVALPVRWANVTATRSGRSWPRRCVSVNTCVRLSIRTPTGLPVDTVRAVTRAIRCALQHPDSWKPTICRRARPPIAHRKVIAIAGGRGARKMGLDIGAARPCGTAPDGRAPVEIGCVRWTRSPVAGGVVGIPAA